MLPLRKISPSRVALSSYYGKVFVDRSTKKVNDSIDWLARQILGQGMSGEGYVITKVAPANVFDNHFQAPRLYSGLSHYIKQVSIAGCEFTFDHTEREQWLSGEELAKAEGTEYRLVGRNSNKELIFMDYEDHLSVYRKGIHFPLGSFYDLCQIDITKSPIDFTELKIFAKSIPVGIVLGYMLGLTNLIKLLKVTPKIYDVKKRIVLNKDEWTIHFKDKKLVFSRQDRLATLILAGFRDYEKSVKNYFLESFDNKNVYLNVMETQGVGVRYIRELEQLNQLFIDPITLSILKELKLPITFMGLILKGSELLLTDDHPDAQDMQYQRIKGYERFAGAVYKELVNSVREFKSRNIRGKSQIEMNPYAVWQTIMQDPSNDLVKDINPIQNLKEEEAVTFVGEGGRSKEGMNKESRAYHPNDMGVVSEATVDSSDVGINAFLSADPNLTSVRGLTTRYDRAKGVTSLVSTSALLSPGASHDD